jgi:succinate dehydrogenase/fumarate reductase flavoprotein subunit
VYRGPDDKPIGPFITKPDKIYGDITGDCWPTLFDDFLRMGKGPVFMDCRGASKEDIDYMKYWLMNEGNKGLLDYLAEEGIDPGEHPIEFRSYEIGLKGGIYFNTKGETSIEGLFSAGDEYHGGMATAVVFGWLAGESAADYSKRIDFVGLEKEMIEMINEKAALLEIFLNREEGPTWREANITIQQIMSDYCGLLRSEGLLDQGLLNIGRLREKVFKTMVARNGHELGRCLEVLNLLDIGEAVMLCAKERKETRGKHNRADYPFTNPLLDKFLYIKRVDGKPLFDWRNK